MSIRFDGDTDYIYRSFSDTDFTIMAWVYPIGGSGSYRVAVGFPDFGDFPNMASNSDNTKWELGDNSTDNVGTQAYTVNTWQHLAWTRTGTTHKLYVNGVLSWSGTWATTWGTGNLKIGQLNASYWMSGRVAHIKIYTAVLSLAEIQAEKERVLPKRTANLWNWSITNPVSTERLLDYSGNGNNWTAAGTLTDEDQPPVSWGAPVLTYSPILVVDDGAMSGTAAAVGGTNSTLTGDGALAGTAAATGGTNTTLTGKGALAGASASQAGSNSTLTGQGVLAGSSAAQAGSNSTLTGKGALRGQSDSVAGTNTTLSGTGSLVGTSNAQSGTNSTLTGDGTLAGTSAAVAGSNSTLTDAGGNLSGSAAAISGATATLTGLGALSGISNAYSTAYATEGTVPAIPSGPVILLNVGGGGGPLPVNERPDYQISYNLDLIKALRVLEEDEELLLILG